ncbi:pyridoxal-phosphate dependent enzyme [Cytophagaceae bacterium ABcell3]|nr:pyridoxal-phosphate dependent enzyme [Cytophagaceae bacterium ABcell3]
MKTTDRILLSRIKYAVSEIDKAFLNSPQFLSGSLSDLLQCKMYLKDETQNPIGSFKGRGAELLVSGLGYNSELVCASAGNFGQALAYSCKKKGVKVTVFASINANSLKVKKMQSLGAKVILYGNDFDEAKSEAKAFAGKYNIGFVEDSLNIETVEGAGTIGLELLNLPSKIEYLLIALGNGALATGIAKVFKHYSPETKIIVVQARGAPAMIESWKKGEVVNLLGADTIADGIAVRLPIPEVVEDMRGLIDEGILVSDESIVEGIRVLNRYEGLRAEPSAAVGIAAILENPTLFSKKNVCSVICGGNLTEEQVQKWL